MPKEPGRLPATSLPVSPDLFDGQAGLFEQRAGLPESCCHEIAASVLAIGKAGNSDLIIEVGAGTGQLGHWFRTPVRYAGFDLSAEMLKEFSRRLKADRRGRLLIRADANTTWPFANGVARVIFSSRAMHLLDQEHAASEILRVASDAGTLILGRVERDPKSVKARMAGEMNECLRRHGFVGRRGERQNRKLFELCSRAGAVELEPLHAAKWRTVASPRQSIDSWRGLKGLGGIQVPDETRADILRELEGWAEQVFGGLDEEFESDETYVLRSLRLPPARDL